MKKFYSLILSVTISIAAHSQALPNAGFELWTNMGTYDNPDTWNTLNDLTSGFGVLTCLKATGADAHSGTAAIKLITQFVIIQNANGLATTGTIDVGNQTVTGGIPYTLRPDSLTGWYKCDPQGTDFGFIDFTLFDGGNDTVGFVHFQTPNSAVTTYTYFSLPINYYNTNTPTLSRCVMSSSEGVSSVLNSMLIVDDLALVFNNTGVREPVFGRSSVKYLSGSKRLKVFAQQPALVTVIDMTGKKLFAQSVQAGYSEFELVLPAGLYVYRISDDVLKAASNGKFLAE
jgi:hypothetical protein